MTIEQTISLRDIGRRLAPLQQSRDKVASDELLSLLKSGEIAAGFRFPGSAILWVKIPTHYWAQVTSAEFRQIRHSRNRKNSGVYTVSPGDFAEDIVTQVNEQLEKKKSEASEEWKAVLKATTRSYEVEITEREWADYLVRHNLTEPGPEIKSKSGRNQKKGWRDLSIIISAYIIKHYETMKEEWPAPGLVDTRLRGPRKIALDRQAPRIYPRMIPLCSRFDSVLFTPKMSAIASYSNFSRSP